MPVNNVSSARAPLQPVAESQSVLEAQVQGLIKRSGHGPFHLTELGCAVAVATRTADEVVGTPPKVPF